MNCTVTFSPYCLHYRPAELRRAGFACENGAAVCCDLRNMSPDDAEVMLLVQALVTDGRKGLVMQQYTVVTLRSRARLSMSDK